MKTRILLTVTLLTLFSSTVFAQKKVGWVTAYWAGWAKTSPEDVAWKSYTHLCIFSATPDGRGGCKLAMGWNDARVKAAVAEGHRNHVKVLLCVGGGGVGRGFVRCTADAATRAIFIQNIIKLMKKYDFDGVDMDWEELEGKYAEYVALHKELRAELDKITPRPLLTAAIANWMFNRTTAEIHPYMDQLNNMSYWTRAVKNGAVNVTDIAKDMQGLVDKGVPKAKLGVGIGLDYEEHRPEVDCDPRACTAKCRFAIDKGYGGVMIWAIEKDAKKSGGKQPCHDAIFPFKATDDGTRSGKGDHKTSVEPEVGTEANRMVEIAFTASRDYGNPFHDVTLDVSFETPQGHTLKVPAFWDGGRVWKVRYASTVLGNHRWRSVCSVAADGGLNGVTGTVIIEPYRGENPLYLHGPLRVAADHRHFEHADGTPFFWLADTWWMGLCQRLHWPQEFQQLAADRKAKGFNAIQIVAGLYPDMPAFDPRANEAGFPWEKDYARIRPEYFDKADQRIFYLVDQGFVPCVVGAWGFHLPWLGVERMKEHWRYLIARYGALPVVWCAAGEGAMPFYGSPRAAEDAAFQKKGWTEVIRSIRATDPFHRLITLHPTQAARDNVTDPTVLDFDMHQTGHASENEIGKMARQMRSAYEAPPKMPVIAGESSYDGLDFKDWGGGVLSSDASRQMFWTGLMQNGAAGGTYGANGVWQVNRRSAPYGLSPHGRSWGSIPWEEAIERPGSTQVGFAKKFFAHYPWSHLEPRPAIAEWADSQPAGDNIQPWAVGAADNLLIVYVPRPRPIKVRQLPPNAAYTANLFDPVAGQSSFLGEIKTDERGGWNCSQPGYKHDWVVVLEKQKATTRKSR